MTTRTAPGPPSTPRVDYETLADLRYHLRRFLRVREEAARAHGVRPQQYLVLLQVKGGERRGPMTMGRLAERLQVRPHAAVQLVDRLADRGWLRRRRAEPDRRGVIVEITPRGAAVLRRLALDSLSQLRTEGPPLAATLRRLLAGGRKRRARVRANRGGRPAGASALGAGRRRRR
jgi:DNA-binding MarR family transcriptional regulator